MQLRRALALTLGLELVIHHSQPLIVFLQATEPPATASPSLGLYKELLLPQASPSSRGIAPAVCSPFHLQPRKVLAASQGPCIKVRDPGLVAASYWR